MAFKRDAIVKVATVVGLVIVIGGVSDAARNIARRCAVPEYYDTHQRWCDSYFKPTYTARRQREQAFPPVQGYDMVTVYRDHQGSGESGPSDKFIALQTAQDVAMSNPIYAYARAFAPGALNLGRNTIAWVHDAVRPARTTTKTVTTRTVTTVVAER